MGPTRIGGLPAHPLLVHLVVTLVPVAALLVALAAVWPAARRRLAWMTYRIGDTGARAVWTGVKVAQS